MKSKNRILTLFLTILILLQTPMSALAVQKASGPNAPGNKTSNTGTKRGGQPLKFGDIDPNLLEIEKKKQQGESLREQKKVGYLHLSVFGFTTVYNRNKNQIQPISNNVVGNVNDAIKTGKVRIKHMIPLDQDSSNSTLGYTMDDFRYISGPASKNVTKANRNNHMNAKDNASMPLSIVDYLMKGTDSKDKILEIDRVIANGHQSNNVSADKQILSNKADGYIKHKTNSYHFYDMEFKLPKEQYTTPSISKNLVRFFENFELVYSMSQKKPGMQVPSPDMDCKKYLSLPGANVTGLQACPAGKTVREAVYEENRKWAKKNLSWYNGGGGEGIAANKDAHVEAVNSFFEHQSRRKGTMVQARNNLITAIHVANVENYFEKDPTPTITETPDSLCWDEVEFDYANSTERQETTGKVGEIVNNNVPCEPTDNRESSSQQFVWYSDVNKPANDKYFPDPIPRPKSHNQPRQKITYRDNYVLDRRMNAYYFLNKAGNPIGLNRAYHVADTALVGGQTEPANVLTGKPLYTNAWLQRYPKQMMMRALLYKSGVAGGGVENYTDGAEYEDIIRMIDANYGNLIKIDPDTGQAVEFEDGEDSSHFKDNFTGSYGKIHKLSDEHPLIKKYKGKLSMASISEVEEYLNHSPRSMFLGEPTGMVWHSWIDLEFNGTETKTVETIGNTTAPDARNRWREEKGQDSWTRFCHSQFDVRIQPKVETIDKRWFNAYRRRVCVDTKTTCESFEGVPQRLNPSGGAKVMSDGNQNNNDYPHGDEMFIGSKHALIDPPEIYPGTPGPEPIKPEKPTESEFRGPDDCYKDDKGRERCTPGEVDWGAYDAAMAIYEKEMEIYNIEYPKWKDHVAAYSAQSSHYSAAVSEWNGLLSPYINKLDAKLQEGYLTHKNDNSGGQIEICKVEATNYRVSQPMPNNREVSKGMSNFGTVNGEALHAQLRALQPQMFRSYGDQKTPHPKTTHVAGPFTSITYYNQGIPDDLTRPAREQIMRVNGQIGIPANYHTIPKYTHDRFGVWNKISGTWNKQPNKVEDYITDSSITKEYKDGSRVTYSEGAIERWTRWGHRTSVAVEYHAAVVDSELKLTNFNNPKNPTVKSGYGVYNDGKAKLVTDWDYRYDVTGHVIRPNGKKPLRDSTSASANIDGTIGLSKECKIENERLVCNPMKTKPSQYDTLGMSAGKEYDYAIDGIRGYNETRANSKNFIRANENSILWETMPGHWHSKKEFAGSNSINPYIVPLYGRSKQHFVHLDYPDKDFVMDSWLEVEFMRNGSKMWSVNYAEPVGIPVKGTMFTDSYVRPNYGDLEREMQGGNDSAPMWDKEIEKVKNNVKIK